MIKLKDLLPEVTSIEDLFDYHESDELIPGYPLN